MKRLFSKPWNRELLWNPQDENAKKVWNRSAPVLFPIVGKLKNDSYNWAGKTYQLNQHGFARDMEFKCIECGASEATFRLEATKESYARFLFFFNSMSFIRLMESVSILFTLLKMSTVRIFIFPLGPILGLRPLNWMNMKFILRRKSAAFFNCRMNW